jgi:hypothetical protein
MVRIVNDEILHLMWLSCHEHESIDVDNLPWVVFDFLLDLTLPVVQQRHIV